MPPVDPGAPAPRERTFLAPSSLAGAPSSAILTPPSPGAYGEIAPSGALQPYVRLFHVCREIVPAHEAVLERVLPDGAVQLHFELGDRPVEVGVGSGEAAEARGAVLAPAMVHTAGRIEGVGVVLRPGGMQALLGVPAGALAGRRVSLDALWGGRAPETLERVAHAPSGAARVAILESVLLDAVRRTDAAPSRTAAEAVRLVHATHGRIRVRELAARLGVGERRLEQLFHAHVGLTPKGACRLARFRAAVERLRADGEERWSAIAHACGYADQSHLVHDVRALTGLAPGALAASLGFGFPQDAARRAH